MFLVGTWYDLFSWQYNFTCKLLLSRILCRGHVGIYCREPKYGSNAYLIFDNGFKCESVE